MAYSYPETEIKIAAEKSHSLINILFQNKGDVIPAEKLPVLFDKFYRLDEARISDTGGTGLGLAIAKEIILITWRENLGIQRKGYCYVRNRASLSGLGKHPSDIRILLGIKRFNLKTRSPFVR